MIRPSSRLGLAALLAGLAASPALAGPSGTFGEWTASCTDGLSCDAFVAFYDDTPGIYSVSLSREARPADAPLRLVLQIPGATAPAIEAEIEVDGEVPVELSLSRPADDPEYGPYGSDDAALADAILPALLAGEQARVSFRAPDGTGGERTLSLEGLSASLRFIDAAQGRADTTVALVAVGDNPAPDPDTLPQDIDDPADLPQNVREVWERTPEPCSQTGGMPVSGASAPHGEGRLYILTCGQGGAYNFSAAAFFDDGYEVRRLVFPTVTERGLTASATIVNHSWDVGAGLVTSWVKYRGIGDCGRQETWRFDTEYGAEPILVEAFEKVECDEAPFEPAPRWQVWPARG